MSMKEGVSAPVGGRTREESVMKGRLMAFAAAGVVATAGLASAEPGGPTFAPAPPSYGPEMGAEEVGPSNDDVYGCHPLLRKLFFWKKDTKCKDCAPRTAPPPPAQQGTLVFPHHPFVRSPRDYFMWQPGQAP
jgi:hypothetical protein